MHARQPLPMLREWRQLLRRSDYRFCGDCVFSENPVTSRAGARDSKSTINNLLILVSACLGFAKLRVTELKKSGTTRQRSKHLRNDFLSTSATTEFFFFCFEKPLTPAMSFSASELETRSPRLSRDGRQVSCVSIR